MFNYWTIQGASEYLLTVACEEMNTPKLCVQLCWKQPHNASMIPCIEVEVTIAPINVLSKEHRKLYRLQLTMFEISHGLSSLGEQLCHRPCRVCCSDLTDCNTMQCEVCLKWVCKSCVAEVNLCKKQKDRISLACLNCAWYHCVCGKAVLNPAGISKSLMRRLCLLGFIDLCGSGKIVSHIYGGKWLSKSCNGKKRDTSTCDDGRIGKRTRRSSPSVV